MFESLNLSGRVYGGLVALGIFVASYITANLANRHHIKAQLVWDGLIWVVIGGIIGARTYHVLDLWEYYQANPWQIVAVWRGGIGIFGAILGGLIGVMAYAHKNRIPRQTVIKLLDLTVLSLPLAQAIGRLGNYFNQELYGSPTSLPFAIYIPISKRLESVRDFEYFHPLFAYEIGLNLILLAVLWGLYLNHRLKVGSGSYVYIYLMGYGLIRTILEPLRIEPFTLGNLGAAQWIGLLMVIGGAAGLVLSKSKGDG